MHRRNGISERNITGVGFEGLYQHCLLPTINKKKNKKYDNWPLPREFDRLRVVGKKEDGRKDSIVDRENPPPTAEDVAPPSICRKLSKNGKLIPEKR